eukprot:3094403-Prymnesium_polylepis.2
MIKVHVVLYTIAWGLAVLVVGPRPGPGRTHVLHANDATWRKLEGAGWTPKLNTNVTPSLPSTDPSVSGQDDGCVLKTFAARLGGSDLRKSV